MNPRKKESKKWSAIPAELSKQIQTVFEENFKNHLVGKKLKVEGRIYPTEIMLRVGINVTGELRFQNFEVSVDHSPEKQNTIAQIHLAVDAIASLMMDYFADEEAHEMPFTWQEYPFQSEKIWLQYTSENSDLEAQANKLLGLEDEASMLNETLEQLEDLGISESEVAEEELSDEEVDTSRPKIFRVPTDNEFDTLNKKKKKKEDMH